MAVASDPFGQNYCRIRLKEARYRFPMMGEFENTLIFFLSDNSASAEIMVRDDTMIPMLRHDPERPTSVSDPLAGR